MAEYVLATFKTAKFEGIPRYYASDTMVFSVDAHGEPIFYSIYQSIHVLLAAIDSDS